MARTRRSRRTLTVIVLVIVSLSLISLDQNGRTHSLTSGIKSVANDIYAPLRQGIVDIINPIGHFFAGAFDYGSVQSQNEQLEKVIGQLRANQAERGFEQSQLRQLMALENLPFLQSLTTVPAQTVDLNLSNFTATITLNKGRADGVDVGYPVVGAGGLVGQVIQSFHHTCVVQLITDGQSKVGVTFGNQLTGIVDGQGPGNDLTLDLVPPHTPVYKGQILYTSGLQAATFPPGIPVATVESFHNEAGASQESITVDPAANLDELAYVDVVQWEPPT
ncbi:MAG TPA: rod shape-determining protein MreC [Acidimicrobiales bacterium]|nr:rod shape-determining protein MreC [Acidimicrobiales bacterium]